MCNIYLIILACKAWNGILEELRKNLKMIKKNLTPPQKKPHNCNRGEPILESLRRSVLFIAILRSHSFIQ